MPCTDKGENLAVTFLRLNPKGKQCLQFLQPFLTFISNKRDVTDLGRAIGEDAVT